MSRVNRNNEKSEKEKRNLSIIPKGEKMNGGILSTPENVCSGLKWSENPIRMKINTYEIGNVPIDRNIGLN